MFVKQVCHSSQPGIVLPAIKTAFPNSSSSVEQSNVDFTSILAQSADNQDTLLSVLDLLHEKR